MTASGFIPVCIHNNKLMFLFGLESPGETSAKGWSDFAGGMEKHENDNSDKRIYDAALREMSEETSGFLGGPKEIDLLVKKNGGFMRYSHDNNGSYYHMHIFRLDYDEKLIQYYNANHKYLYDNLDHKMLQKTKVFEKIELQWFSLEMMKKQRNQFRSFYRDIVDMLISESKSVYSFTKKSKQNNQTRKQYM